LRGGHEYSVEYGDEYDIGYYESLFKELFMLRWLCVLMIGVLTTRACEAGADFEASVAPILSAKCVECHNAKDKSGGLDLTSGAALMRGGDSGAVLVPTKPGESPLYQRVEQGEMPPESAGKSHKLPDVEIAALKEWITAGAQWPKDRVLDLYERTNESRAGRDWWTFQSVKRPSVPVVLPKDRVRTPVDAFIFDRLNREKLTMAPEAGPRALVRRAYEDLWGLPPTYEQIEEYVNDHSRMRGSSIGSSHRLIMASGGGDTGWMSCVMPRRVGMNATSSSRESGSTATG
jgi:hypothetical protein